MTTVALDIKPLLNEWDRSSPLTVWVTGVPAGASLSAGTPYLDGGWKVAGEALDGLSLTPAGDCEATALYLSVRASWTEIFNGSEVDSEQTVRLRVELPQLESLDFSQLIPCWGGLEPFASR